MLSLTCHWLFEHTDIDFCPQFTSCSQTTVVLCFFFFFSVIWTETTWQSSARQTSLLSNTSESCKSQLLFQLCGGFNSSCVLIKFYFRYDYYPEHLGISAFSIHFCKISHAMTGQHILSHISLLALSLLRMWESWLRCHHKPEGTEWCFSSSVTHEPPGGACLVSVSVKFTTGRGLSVTFWPGNTPMVVSCVNLRPGTVLSVSDGHEV